MTKTVNVYCDLPSGVVLNNYEMREGELGIKTAFRTGEPVTLKNGLNEGVDAKFFKDWLKANADSDLVTSNCVRLVEEPKPEPKK